MALCLFALAGIILGCVVIFDPMLNYFRLTQSLLDGNILNVIAPERGFIAFFFSRFLDVFFGLLLIFLFAMTKWTVLLVFPYIAFRGFWMVVNLFWIIDRYGILHGLPFFLVYLVIFFLLIVLFICACIFILRRGTVVRQYGFRVGCSWRETQKGLMLILFGIAAVAFVEWLLYFALLRHLIYVF